MNKPAIKSFAIWARNKLLADITYKAGLMGVTDKGIAEPLPQSTRDMQFFDIGTGSPYAISGKEIVQRERFVEIIKNKASKSDHKTALDTVFEEVAYTWFNRLIAVRFMEANDYLPSRVRVLSSESKGKAEPDLVTAPFDSDMEFSDAEKAHIAKLKQDNKLDELFRLLFIKQCNALNAILPELFERTCGNDYTELLLTISYADKDGVVSRLVNDIAEEDFRDQVQIIGWMYQYYNTEPKDETFALLKKNVKITKERIPTATQLFTPDWIVCYMVENSLGRLWLEGHPDNALRSGWKYYLDEAEQEESVKVQLDTIRNGRKTIKPEDITVIDPCMGSGHILVYAFDVLVQIYKSQGYSQRDAAKLILQNNLFGLDIDKRAYQLAYFSLMMKARQYNRRIFNENIMPQVYCPEVDAEGEEYGSLLLVEELEPKPLVESDLLSSDDAEKIRRWNFRRLLTLKYDVVVTNPPYMGSSGMNDNLSGFVKKHYPDSKSDLFAAFIEKCSEMARTNGYMAMITQHAWMFLSSFEKLRGKMLRCDIVNMVHLGSRAFAEIGGEVVQSTMFVIHKARLNEYKGSYVRLVDYSDAELKETKYLEALADRDYKYLHSINADNFAKIPGMPIAYSLSNTVIKAFASVPKLSDIATTRLGMTTANNNKFTRFWYELKIGNCIFNAKNAAIVLERKMKWVPYNKGGQYRKWYGNLDIVVNWENNGYQIKNYADENGHIRSTVPNTEYYFLPCLTWSKVSSGNISFRFRPQGSIFDVAGACIYSSNNLIELLGLINSKVCTNILSVLSPTLNYEGSHIASLPIMPLQHISVVVDSIVQQNVSLSRADWDSFETSWDFKCLPLIASKDNTVTESYVTWQAFVEKQFLQLKANEEELNRIFIEIYGLQDELTPEVADKDVTVARIYDTKDDIPTSMKGNSYVLTKTDVVKSFLSYAVGCMFGRYSLDVDGLAYAGGDWDNDKYSSFIPDKGNIIPITDEEYYEDDIVGRFVEFVKVVYGEETLEDNLEFIATSLGNKGNSSHEMIRNYFMKDFFKDHCKTYKKRPLYWLFESGKQDGFRALVYMHRYDENTIGNLRIDYLHRIQRVYDREIARMQETIENSTNGREVAAAEKRKEKLTKQLKETRDYDAKIAHLALARITIDLDDGVKVNYEKVQTGTDGKKLDVLGKI